MNRSTVLRRFCSVSSDVRFIDFGLTNREISNEQDYRN